MDDDNERTDESSDMEEPTRWFDPNRSDYLPVSDERDRFRQQSKECEPAKDHRRVFYRRTLGLVESADIAADLRNTLKHSLEHSLTAEEANAEDSTEQPPIPGGVGYGCYYNNHALEFHQSSVLYYHIVTIPTLGSTPNKWLYLTATNRSPRGVEAYISYRDQDEPWFTVFDWSKYEVGQDPWSLYLPYSELGDYLGNYPDNGTGYQTIFVANSTRRLGETTWRNEVLLLNRVSQAYDLVYAHDYNLSAIEQIKYKWWGPIVEGAPPFPFQTNAVGFFDAQLMQEGAAPKLLTPDVTFLRNDYQSDPHFEVVSDPEFERKHHSFIVHWRPR